MKQLIILCHFVFLITVSIGQITAVTNNGDEVVLYSDGTWKYVNSNQQEQGKIDTNKTEFSKPINSTFIVKSNKLNCGIYIDPKKWGFVKSGSDEDSEFSFNLKGKDGYGLLIAEKTEIPVETLRDVAIENAKDAEPDITITNQEYRKVNNNTVILLQMNGTLKGMKITYLGYYFSSPEGSIQLITYAATNLFKEHKSDLEEFLNGFVIIKK